MVAAQLHLEVLTIHTCIENGETSPCLESI